MKNTLGIFSAEGEIPLRTESKSIAADDDVSSRLPSLLPSSLPPFE